MYMYWSKEAKPYTAAQSSVAECVDRGFPAAVLAGPSPRVNEVVAGLRAVPWVIYLTPSFSSSSPLLMAWKLKKTGASLMRRTVAQVKSLERN